MVKKLKAFTLVETIISMAIIIIVSFCILPVLTKSKSRTIDSVSLRGQYGCWYDTTQNSLMEWYFNERTPRTPEPRPVTECKLVLDTRPANFYILASGAGSDFLPGQVKSVYTPALGNHLDIEIGRTGTFVTTTTVSTGASAETIASGANPSTASYSSGLIPENIKSCKVFEGEACAIDCEVLQKTNYESTDEYIVRINGCESIDEFGNPNTKVIDLTDLRYSGAAGAQDLKDIPPSAINTYSAPNGYYYYDNTGYKLNFEFYDSSYVYSDMILGYTNNTSNNYNSATKSKMSEIIDSISTRRQSRLTVLLSGLNAGAPRTDGAVLILW